MEERFKIVQVDFSYLKTFFEEDSTDPIEAGREFEIIKIAVPISENYKTTLKKAEERMLSRLPLKDEVEDPEEGKYKIDLCYDDIQLISYKVLAEETY